MKSTFCVYCLLIAALAGLGGFSPVHADVKVHGFANLVGSFTGSDLEVPGMYNRGRELNTDGASNVGLNLSSDLGDQWDFAGQIVARGNGGISGQSAYIAAADWLFVSYRPDDHWLIRAGRQIYPLYLYSEQFDVGFIYPWVRLPPSVYSISPFKSFNGALASYSHTMGDWKLSGSIYGGGGTYQQISVDGVDDGLNIYDKQMQAALLSLESSTFKIFATYKSSRPTADYFVANPTASGNTQVKIHLDFERLESWGTGARYDNGAIMLLTEAGGYKSTARDMKQTGLYASIGYHLFSGFLTPHFTYGRQWTVASYLVHPDRAQALNSPGNMQEGVADVIAGMSVRATNSVVLKAEYERGQYRFRDRALDFDAETYSFGVSAVF